MTNKNNTMKRYWNYSIDCLPRDKHNIPPKRDLCFSHMEAVRCCKQFCRDDGIEFSPEMVAEVTDLINQ